MPLRQFKFGSAMAVCSFAIGCKSTDPSGSAATSYEADAPATSAETPWVTWPTMKFLDAGRELGASRQRLLKENMIDTNSEELDKDPVTGKTIVCDERSCPSPENFVVKSVETPDTRRV